MSYKQNCTKGPVNIAAIDQDSDHIEVFAGVSDGPQIAVAKGTSHTIDKDAYYTGIANATLIAEAFNVLAETGMTPRELAEEMYKAVREQARQQDRAEIAALKAEVERLRKATAEVLEGEDLGLITWDCQCEEEIGITCGCCQAFEQLSAALDKKHRPCP